MNALRLAIGLTAASLLIANMPGPEPQTLRPTMPTPETLTAQFNAEQQQARYDAAEEVASHVLRTHCGDDEYAEPIAHAALDNNISVRVATAVLVVESTCRPDVVSAEGAVGLMQVVPRVWHVSSERLHNPDFNIRKGTEILAAYMRGRDVRAGLRRYNGLGEGCEACDDAYPDKVLTVAYGRPN